MNFFPTAIPEVVRIEPQVFGDSRGFFLETYRADRMAAAGITAQFVQDNHSGSHKNILRGLHYQIRQAQGKLVRAISGEIFDGAVDLRRSSPTYGHWVGEVLSAGNKRMLWIPPGFAHGFYVLSDWAEVLYKTTEYYSPEWERTLVWNDPAVGIRWPIPPGPEPILSAKDASGARLADAEVYE
jgi:dTDP-4-dehydrorhamnose 3,5-epimerase